MFKPGDRVERKNTANSEYTKRVPFGARGTVIGEPFTGLLKNEKVLRVPVRWDKGTKFTMRSRHNRARRSCTLAELLIPLDE